MAKYVIVVGSSVTNVGKGVIVGSLGRLFKNRGLKVDVLKFDPCLNVDFGTMSPYQHGEVFVTNDGTDCDLDIGHYERFLDVALSKENNVTVGRLFTDVINKERQGKYVGASVQSIPHVSAEAKEHMLALGNTDADIVLVEVGGTLNDSETSILLDAVRTLRTEVGTQNVFIVLADILPRIEVIHENKVEALQTSVKLLNVLGLQPNALVCRTKSNVKFTDDVKARIARRCYLNGAEYVIQEPDVETIYEVPLTFQAQGFDSLILKYFGIKENPIDLNSWQFMVNNFKSNYQELRVCIVGKYTKVPDAYISVEEAIRHAASFNHVKAKVDLIDAEDIEEFGVDRFLRGAKAIIVPSGWGNRGVDGMIKAIGYARENKIPYLGINYGMELAAIEFARNVMGIKGANTTEVDPQTEFPVIDIMEEQKKLVLNGKTMRVGAFNCALDPNSMSAKLYGSELISERHRHRYEFNSAFYERFEKEGMVVAGMNPETKLVEILELKNHPFFIGTIFVPEMLSRPNKPHPLFLGLLNAAKSVR
ncbi:MAG: CTP synthase [Clostridia bacterium]|nr:CTP synthase [Clostridia bacterium]